MGQSAFVNADKFPDQTEWVGRKVRVSFNDDTRRQIGGVVVRDDAFEPHIGIIKLDDGRHVLATECQYTDM